MGMSVERLLREFSSRELSEWAAYYKLEPFGEDRADLRLSFLTTLMHNLHRKSGVPAFKVEDFLIGDQGKSREDETPKQKLDRQKMILQDIAEHFKSIGKGKKKGTGRGRKRR